MIHNQPTQIQPTQMETKKPKYRQCECGGKYKSTTKYNHNRTKRHLLYCMDTEDIEYEKNIKEIKNTLNKKLQNIQTISSQVPNKYSQMEKVIKQLLCRKK